MGQRPPGLIHWNDIVIAGFFTGGALAIRGGMKAARNSAIGCGILLAVIEGVGIGIQRMMAENTRLDVRLSSSPLPLPTTQTNHTNLLSSPSTATGTSPSFTTSIITRLRLTNDRMMNPSTLILYSTQPSNGISYIPTALRFYGMGPSTLY